MYKSGICDTKPAIYLIRPTVSPQCRNVTDRTGRHDDDDDGLY